MSEYNFNWKYLRRHKKWMLFEAGAAVVAVVPDQTWPGMWRIDEGKGQLSDMVNLSRAKDAATMIARRNLDLKGGDSRSNGPPMRQNGDRLSE